MTLGAEDVDDSRAKRSESHQVVRECEDHMLLFVTSCHGVPLRLKAEDCMCIYTDVWQQLCTDVERSMIRMVQ